MDFLAKLLNNEANNNNKQQIPLLSQRSSIRQKTQIKRDITEYINIQRFQKHLPSFLNCYYDVNLIQAVEKLPHSDSSPDKLLTRKLQNKNPSKNQDLKTQEKLQNITLVTNNQIDKLNQDILVNDYVFTKNVLGRGAHSVVRLAKYNNNFYAVKIIHFQKVRKKFFIKEDNLIKMINAQMRFLKMLADCKNVINHYQSLYSVERQKVFVVLQYCEKGSLLKISQTQGNFNRKNKQKFQKWIKTIQAYFKQLVNGVYQIHKLNIIHRDIKPQNILLTQENIIKIIDFNISEQIQQNGMIKVNYSKFIGTKGYAAPQLLLSNNKKQCMIKGKALDIWALGISLLQILQNRHPLQCRSLQTLQNSIQRQIPLNPNYSKDLKQLLKGMLEKDNARRFTIQQIIQSKWLSQ